MVYNNVNTVFSVNGSSEGHVVEGEGQATVSDMLNHYPLVKRGKVNIVVLRGFMVNDTFVPFNPELYARERR